MSVVLLTFEKEDITGEGMQMETYNTPQGQPFKSYHQKPLTFTSVAMHLAYEQSLVIPRLWLDSGSGTRI